MITRKTGRSGKNVQVNLTKAFDGLKKKLYSDVAKIVEEGFSDIVTGTPVDTGYAKSNWFVLYGDKPGIPAPAKTGGPYRGEDEVVSNGSFVIRILKKNGFTEGLRFYNPTRYMGMLEYGHSSQNKFFIRSSVKKMTNKISSIR